MACVPAILAALWKAVRRGGKSAGSFASNNLFLVSVAFLFFKDPGAFVSLNVLIALVLFFPLSADPLRKIPAARLALWPLTRRERALVRILAPWLNPMPWLLAALALHKGIAVELWALIAGLFAIAFLAPALPLGGRQNLFRAMPHFPGALDQLIRKNLREALCTLDFYCALLVSAAALAFRCAGQLPREALFPMTMPVMLALSTYAGNLFGLDGRGGLTRYRLLPIPGWQVLAAKDAAFLLIAVALTLPLSPVGGLAAALAGLAYGHYASVNRRRPETRWRFSTAASFSGGLLQVVAMALAAAGAIDGSVLLLAPCAAAYAWSTWHWGKALAAGEAP
jgi:hypothetical protein